jgi:hypothetical protein
MNPYIIDSGDTFNAETNFSYDLGFRQSIHFLGGTEGTQISPMKVQASSHIEVISMWSWVLRAVSDHRHQLNSPTRLKNLSSRMRKRN